MLELQFLPGFKRGKAVRHKPLSLLVALQSLASLVSEDGIGKSCIEAERVQTLLQAADIFLS